MTVGDDERVAGSEASGGSSTRARGAGWALVPSVVAACVGVIGIAVATIVGIPAEYAFRDATVVAAETAAARPYFGFVSNVGVLIMATTAGMAALAVWSGRFAGRPTAFFAWAAAFTAVFAFDDLQMLHEALPQRVPHGHLILFGVLAVLLLGALRLHDRWTSDAPTMLLGLALAGFVLSLGVDLLGETGVPTSTVLEDWLKLLGICNWAGYVAFRATRTPEGTPA